MTGPVPYILFPGTARTALEFYHDVFGGSIEMYSLKDLSRTDGPLDNIGHGQLTGEVNLFAADASGTDTTVKTEGLMMALLGTATPATLREWFAKLSEGGTVIDPLTAKPWGDTDGQVVDRYGLHWLIGYQGTDSAMS
ncbi:VOC family protein [Neomicrococcus aestuarii]|uniref:VOC family protein n=1 Tax=Neomicrococcus aestuarii TaxID=556325 RepID=A0A1L2ZQV6_9MICC|nr:VOC family protein [Neomicrococcus aestuarii]APF41734.1 VOC family protein [Neomicrococcus aestuarii]